jgi:hypothetical protein
MKAPINALKPLQLALLLSCTLGLSAPSSGETFYKWVDEEGVTHYGNKPSKQHNSSPVLTSGRASGPASKMAPNKPAAKKDQPSNPNEGSVIYDAEELKQYCQNIQKRLTMMTSRNQIKQKNKDGSVVMLTEEQRQQQIADMKAQITDKCN